MRNLKLLFAILATVITANCFAQNDSIYHFELNGKDYELIKIMKSYEDACNYASARNAHLVHVDDSLESAGIYDAIINGAEVPVDYTTCYDAGNIAYVWIGATDALTEGEWLWDGDNDGIGDNFWNGEGSLGSGNGESVNNAFVNWGGKNAGTYNEPDNYSNQDAAAIALDGWPNGTGNFGIASEWNDIKTYNELYFIVEYEGNYGIKEAEKNSLIKIFPNPARDFLNVESKTGIKNIEIIDLTGSIVIQITTNAKRTSELDLRNLTKGIYVLKIIDVEGIILYHKFVIE